MPRVKPAKSESRVALSNVAKSYEWHYEAFILEATEIICRILAKRSEKKAWTPPAPVEDDDDSGIPF